MYWQKQGYLTSSNKLILGVMMFYLLEMKTFLLEVFIFQIHFFHISFFLVIIFICGCCCSSQKNKNIYLTWKCQFIFSTIHNITIHLESLSIIWNHIEFNLAVCKLLHTFLNIYVITYFAKENSWSRSLRLTKIDTLYVA